MIMSSATIRRLSDQCENRPHDVNSASIEPGRTANHMTASGVMFWAVRSSFEPCTMVIATSLKRRETARVSLDLQRHGSRIRRRV
jgi:hypothetical protein